MILDCPIYLPGGICNSLSNYLAEHFLLQCYKLQMVVSKYTIRNLAKWYVSAPPPLPLRVGVPFLWSILDPSISNMLMLLDLKKRNFYHLRKKTFMISCQLNQQK